RGIVRAHGDAAVVRAEAAPADAAGVAPLDVGVFGVAGRCDGRLAVHVDMTNFARRNTHGGQLALLGNEGDAGAGRTAQLGAAAHAELDRVDVGAGRDVAERQAVARLDVGGVGRQHLVADLQPRRRQDVGLLAVGVLQERDAGRAVRVVLDPHHLGRHAGLVALEVDHPVAALVAAAAEPGGDPAVRVAAAGRGLLLEQLLLRLALGDRREVLAGHAAPPRRGRLVSLDRHGPRLPRRTRSSDRAAG